MTSGTTDFSGIFAEHKGYFVLMAEKQAEKSF
jgi:hypothetical protein